MKNMYQLLKNLWQVSIVAVFTLLTFNQAIAGNATVPFEASFTGTAELNLCIFIAHCHGEGIATHLGLTSSDCVSNLLGYGRFEECEDEEGGTGFGIPNINTATLTAANGDKLVLVTDDLACEILPLRSFHGTGFWQVDPLASTGRFAGTTGAGFLEGHADFVDGVFESKFSGVISYSE